MDKIVNFIVFVTIITLGLSAGAMLTEATVFVQIWQTMPPGEFLKWFSENEPLLVRFYGSLETASAILILVTTIFFWIRGYRGKYLSLISFLMCIGVIITFFLYFQTANASFTASTIALGEVKSELSRWAIWQWARTALGIGGFATALFAIWRNGVGAAKAA